MPSHRIFHLVTASEWAAGQRDGRYTPARFSTDGFVHCTGDQQQTAQVVAAYFSKVTEPVLLLEIEVAKLDAEVKWEAPISVSGKVEAHHTVGATFPHIYGSIPLHAVVSVTTLLNAAK